MKPKNFPGRKNKRRKAVIARGQGDNWLLMKILDDTVARDIRTKKDRSDRGNR